MNILFPEQDPEHILQELRDVLAAESLGKVVSIERKSGELRVLIRKMGTSTLTFKESIDSDGIEWSLTTEKVALAHKPLRDKMIHQFSKVIRKLGGEMNT